MGSNEPTFSYTKGSSLFCITIIVLTNSYGHPHAETLQRLEGVGTRIYCTAEDGEVITKVSDGEVSVRLFGNAWQGDGDNARFSWQGDGDNARFSWQGDGDNARFSHDTGAHDMAAEIMPELCGRKRQND